MDLAALKFPFKTEKQTFIEIALTFKSITNEKFYTNLYLMLS